VWFEVIRAPGSWSELQGQRLRLDWHDPQLARLAMDVHFSDEALESVADGGVHPLRLNHWRQVTPLESLAGARPLDDQLVRLTPPVLVLPETQDQLAQEPGRQRLVVHHEPLQTTGTALALVHFEAPPGASEAGEATEHPAWSWTGVSFDPQTGRFDGARLRLRLPPPVANSEGIAPSTSRGLAQAATNRTGWYVSGVPDGDGGFVVQSMVPRSLQRFAPERVISGQRRAWDYIKRQAWHQPQAGSSSSVLVTGRPLGEQEALAEWQPGDRLLVLHVFGGIGGQQREAALASGLCTGHFAYGVATLEREPLSGELGLELTYRQVYAHNPDGIIAGAQDRWRYLGDRQWGWLGTRPVADILVRFPPLTASYQVQGHERSLLGDFERHLAAMTARYRLGDGTGATFVGPANNCSQDSNQALFAAIQGLQQQMRQLDHRALRSWQLQDPAQAMRLRQLLLVEKDLRRALLPFAGLRPDWQRQRDGLGTSLEDQPLDNLLRGLGSWRALLPRMASDTVINIFLRHGASALVMRASQLGGEHPEIEPVAPLTLGW
jgi:predicted Abi (CAAX) family protease